MTAGPAATGAGAPIITFRGVTKVFRTGKDELRAVDDVDLEIRRGEVFGVVGYSGAGKSTLVRLINALEGVDAGTIDVDGRRVTDARRARPALAAGRHRHGLPAVQPVRRAHGRRERRVPARVLAGTPKAQRKARVAELLRLRRARRQGAACPAQLSGGQKQRVGIARALATSRRSCSRTRRPAPWTPRPRGTSWTCCAGSTRARRDHRDHHARDERRAVRVPPGRGHGARPRRRARRRVRRLRDPKQVATRRFIQTALHDRPAPDVVARLREPPGPARGRRRPGRTPAPAWTSRTLAAGSRVGVGIVYGGVTQVADRPFGSLTLVTGADVDVVLGRVREVAGDVVDLGTADDPLPDVPGSSRGRPTRRRRGERPDDERLAVGLPRAAAVDGVGQTLQMVLSRWWSAARSGWSTGSSSTRPGPAVCTRHRVRPTRAELLVNFVRPIPFIIFITAVRPVTIAVARVGARRARPRSSR